MKKAISGTLICVSLLLISCGKSNEYREFAQVSDNNQIIGTTENEKDSEQIVSENSVKKEKVLELYQEFLEGKIDIDDLNIDDLTIPTGEPERRYPTRYALGDSNGDSIPELHVDAARYYYIFTYMNGKLSTWKKFSSGDYYPLKNGGIMETGLGIVSNYEFAYYMFDYFGEETLCIRFSVNDTNNNSTFDDGDEYFCDDVLVTKDEWDKLTESYLYRDENGIYQIADELEWEVLFEEDDILSKDTQLNNYFFPLDQTQVKYNGIIYPLSSEELRQEITLDIMKVADGETGILYKLELQQPPVEDSFEMISMGRRYLGYYYVTEKNIYLRFVDSMDGYTVEKDKKIIEELQMDEKAFIDSCYIVCSEEDTDRTPDENGYYSYVEKKENGCIFHRYNSYMGGSKDYYTIEWENGKGIVYYLHGAGNRLMEIELFQAENEK